VIYNEIFVYLKERANENVTESTKNVTKRGNPVAIAPGSDLLRQAVQI